MARYAPNSFYSGAFNTIKNGNARRILVLSSEVTVYANLAAATLAEEEITDSEMNEASGAVSGRRLVIDQMADLDITASGDATHVAIVDDDDDAVLYITTCTSQALTNGGTVTIPSWSIEIRAPAAP